jgi:hypothetical protein
VTLPNFLNASLRLSSVVDQDRFPMKQRYSSPSAISARADKHNPRMGKKKLLGHVKKKCSTLLFGDE